MKANDEDEKEQRLDRAELHTAPANVSDDDGNEENDEHVEDKQSRKSIDSTTSPPRRRRDSAQSSVSSRDRNDNISSANPVAVEGPLLLNHEHRPSPRQRDNDSSPASGVGAAAAAADDADGQMMMMQMFELLGPNAERILIADPEALSRALDRHIERCLELTASGSRRKDGKRSAASGADYNAVASPSTAKTKQDWASANLRLQQQEADLDEDDESPSDEKASLEGRQQQFQQQQQQQQQQQSQKSQQQRERERAVSPSVPPAATFCRMPEAPQLGAVAEQADDEVYDLIQKSKFEKQQQLEKQRLQTMSGKQKRRKSQKSSHHHHHHHHHHSHHVAIPVPKIDDDDDGAVTGDDDDDDDGEEVVEDDDDDADSTQKMRDALPVSFDDPTGLAGKIAAKTDRWRKKQQERQQQEYDADQHCLNNNGINSDSRNAALTPSAAAANATVDEDDADDHLHRDQNNSISGNVRERHASVNPPLSSTVTAAFPRGGHFISLAELRELKRQQQRDEMRWRVRSRLGSEADDGSSIGGRSSLSSGGGGGGSSATGGRIRGSSVLAGASRGSGQRPNSNNNHRHGHTDNSRRRRAGIPVLAGDASARGGGGERGRAVIGFSPASGGGRSDARIGNSGISVIHQQRIFVQEPHQHMCSGSHLSSSMFWFVLLPGAFFATWLGLFRASGQWVCEAGICACENDGSVLYAFSVGFAINAPRAAFFSFILEMLMSQQHEPPQSHHRPHSVDEQHNENRGQTLQQRHGVNDTSATPAAGSSNRNNNADKNAAAEKKESAGADDGEEGASCCSAASNVPYTKVRVWILIIFSVFASITVEAIVGTVNVSGVAYQAARFVSVGLPYLVYGVVGGHTACGIAVAGICALPLCTDFVPPMYRADDWRRYLVLLWPPLMILVCDRVVIHLLHMLLPEKIRLTTSLCIAYMITAFFHMTVVGSSLSVDYAAGGDRHVISGLYPLIVCVTETLHSLHVVDVFFTSVFRAASVWLTAATEKIAGAMLQSGVEGVAGVVEGDRATNVTTTTTTTTRTAAPHTSAAAVRRGAVISVAQRPPPPADRKTARKHHARTTSIELSEFGGGSVAGLSVVPGKQLPRQKQQRHQRSDPRQYRQQQHKPHKNGNRDDGTDSDGRSSDCSGSTSASGTQRGKKHGGDSTEEQQTEEEEEEEEEEEQQQQQFSPNDLRLMGAYTRAASLALVSLTALVQIAILRFPKKYDFSGCNGLFLKEEGTVQARWWGAFGVCISALIVGQLAAALVRWVMLDESSNDGDRAAESGSCANEKCRMSSFLAAMSFFPIPGQLLPVLAGMTIANWFLQAMFTAVP